jgi:hypothetical protein
MRSFKPESAFAKIMFYGDPGTGKTTLLGTGMEDPRTTPMLWLDCGGNPESIRHNAHLPTILHIDRIDDLNAPHDWLLKGQPDKHPFVTMCEKLEVQLTPPYKSIVAVDCMTELQRMYIKKFSGNADKHPGDELAAVELREWGTTLMALINMISQYKQLPMHVFTTCHEDERRDKSGAYLRSTVWLWGQGRVEVPAYMLAQIRLVRTNEIPADMRTKLAERGQSDAINIAYFDQLGPFDAKQQYVAKRLGWMPAPTLSKVLDVLEIK